MKNNSNEEASLTKYKLGDIVYLSNYGVGKITSMFTYAGQLIAYVYLVEFRPDFSFWCAESSLNLAAPEQQTLYLLEN